jgi:calcineurin-like phosphoesterase family protein
MNKDLIVKWNTKVKTDDTVYFLGDFAMGKFNQQELADVFNQLNGTKHLIYGNHDHSAVKNLSWTSQQDILTVTDYGFKIVLFHYPMRSWNGMYHGAYHLFGHEHGNMPNLEKAADVGADSWNMFPVTFAEIKQRLDQEQIEREQTK